MPALALAAQFAKLMKIACGHDQTHVRHAQLDLKRLLQWEARSTLTLPTGKARVGE